MKPPPPEGEEAASTRSTTTVAPATVEATKPVELRKQTYGFVQTYGATTPNLDQLARWTQPVCVTVQGVQAAVTAELKGRIEEVAKALASEQGPPAARPTSRPSSATSPRRCSIVWPPIMNNCWAIGTIATGTS